MTAPLPNRSVRIAPEHGDILNSVLTQLRAGRADQLRQILATLDQQPVGPFRSAEAALGFLLARLVAAAHPQAIWLFGSRARGDHHPESDFDLLAIFPDGDDLDDMRNRMADAVAATGLGVDLLACSASEFEQFSDVAGSMIRTVRAEGYEVYRSPSLRRHGP